MVSDSFWVGFEKRAIWGSSKEKMEGDKPKTSTKVPSILAPVYALHAALKNISLLDQHGEHSKHKKD
jgi:hypothetical protein